MRQVGILAAAGLWALDHNLDRLGEDHERAHRLALGSNSLEGLRAEEPDTNIVMIHLERDDLDEETVASQLEVHGVLILPAGPGRLRAVTHLDVDDQGIDRCLEALSQLLA